MCRGANLGVCCALGCDNRIRCQDTGGYCDAHDPYDFSYCECEGDCTCPPLPERPPDDPRKRRTYDLARVTQRIQTVQADIQQKQQDLKSMRRRQAKLRAETRP